MKSNFFNNKLLPILSVFLLVVFIFTSSVFAATDLFTYTDFDSDNTFDAPVINNNDYPYYFVHNSYGTCYTILDDINGYFYLGSTSPRRIYASCSSKCYFINSSGDGWYLVASNPSGQVSNVDSVDEDFGIIDFHCTVYTDINKSEIFFQAPPQITTILVEETERVQIAEQLKTMIVGFLKYLIVLVISLIAFWKGWQFLLTQLKKA